MTKETTNSYAKYLNQSTFIKYIVNNMATFIGRHVNETINNIGNGTSFIDSGTNQEKYLKKVMEISGNVRNHLEDLHTTTKYLNIDRTKINFLYGQSIEQDDYFKYHYDNFIIRVATSIDICGKVGNVVYDLKIEDKYCNWASFANHPKMKGTEPSIKLLAFAEYLEEFRILRHSKVHKGKTSANRFDNVIFWDSFNFTKKPIDPILQELTDQQLEEEINDIGRVIDDIARLTCNFLDTMTMKLKEQYERQV